MHKVDETTAAAWADVFIWLAIFYVACQHLNLTLYSSVRNVRLRNEAMYWLTRLSVNKALSFNLQ